MIQHKSQSFQADTISDRARVWSVSVDCDFDSFSGRSGWRLEGMWSWSSSGVDAQKRRIISPEWIMDLDLYVGGNIAALFQMSDSQPLVLLCDQMSASSKTDNVICCFEITNDI